MNKLSRFYHISHGKIQYIVNICHYWCKQVGYVIVMRSFVGMTVLLAYSMRSFDISKLVNKKMLFVLSRMRFIYKFNFYHL